MSKFAITNQRALRAAFWDDHPKLLRVASYSQNDYPTDTRVAWCDFVEHLAREGHISEALAQRATL